MDSITQIILGAAVGKVTQGEKLGNRAMIWGAIAGTIPDLDVFVGKLFTNPVDELAFHRGISHSFFFAATFSVLMAGLTYWIYDKGHYKKISFAYTIITFLLGCISFILFKSGGSKVGIIGAAVVGVPTIWYGLYRYLKYRRGDQFSPINLGFSGWYKLFFWSIITHPMLDCFTVYGTQIFLPFSNHRVSFNNISVIDPIYTIPFLICLIAAAIFSRKSKYRSTINKAGILISSLYMIWTIYNKQRVNKIVEDTLTSEGISYSRYMTSPTILNNILWSTTVESDSVFYQGYYSFFDKEKKFKLISIPKNKHLIPDSDGDYTIETLKWFSKGYFGIIKRNDGRLQFNDLRFGSHADHEPGENDYIFRFVLKKDADEHYQIDESVAGGPPRGREKEMLTKLWARIQGTPASSTPRYKNGVVSTAHGIASDVGIDILKQGGNAFDAAVAVNFALAVVYPRAGNLGGGGFAVFFDKNGNKGTLDFREKAPSTASRDMYLDKDGLVIKKLSLRGGLASGVPGTVSGMKAIHDSLGRLPLSSLLRPAINLSRDGFPISQNEADRLNKYKSTFLQYNKKKTPYTKSGIWKANDILKNKDLATTLERLSNEGLEEFYTGTTADMIADHSKASGGLINKSDLKDYTPIWRTPIECNYNGYQILSMPPPSSGGVALCQILDGVKALRLDTLAHNSTAYIHRLAEIEKRVFTIRNRVMGDPDFVNIDVSNLMSSEFTEALYSNIGDTSTAEIIDVITQEQIIKEAYETTHFSIIDNEGNAVSITTTLNGNYGSFVVVEDAGFLLNNEMDDFSSKPGVPNQYGLLGSENNAIQPNKRMLSSMTPTIVLRDNKPYLILGSPGGPTIITSVLQTLLNVIDHNMTLQEAVDASRFHDQGYPLGVLTENQKFTSSTLDSLRALGHSIRFTSYIGSVEAIIVNLDGTMEGAADFTRGIDDKVSGY